MSEQKKSIVIVVEEEDEESFEYVSYELEVALPALVQHVKLHYGHARTFGWSREAETKIFV